MFTHEDTLPKCLRLHLLRSRRQGPPLKGPLRSGPRAANVDPEFPLNPERFGKEENAPHCGDVILLARKHESLPPRPYTPMTPLRDPGRRGADT